MKEEKQSLVDKYFESIYNRGFHWNSCDSTNIFGLVRQVKEYTADMDKDQAVEEAVYAAVDFVKDGKL